MQNNDNITGILARSERGFITWDDIENAINQYKVKLPNPEYLFNKSVTFEGLIRYLYNTVIKPIIPNTYNNDYKLLDDIFNNIYVPLCSIYGFQLNIILFCLLTNINECNISVMSKGRDTHGEPIANQEAQRIVRKWYRACESGLFSNVTNHSSIGSMFILKSVYGYREEQTLRIESDSNAPRITTNQIESAMQSEDVPLLPTENE